MSEFDQLKSIFLKIWKWKKWYTLAKYPLYISGVAITEKLTSLENKADTMHQKSKSTEQDNRDIALTVHNNP